MYCKSRPHSYQFGSSHFWGDEAARIFFQMSFAFCIRCFYCHHLRILAKEAWRSGGGSVDGQEYLSVRSRVYWFYSLELGYCTALYSTFNEALLLLLLVKSHGKTRDHRPTCKKSRRNLLLPCLLAADLEYHYWHRCTVRMDMEYSTLLGKCHRKPEGVLVLCI